MKKPFVMRVKDFGNRLKTLNLFLALMPQDEEKDLIFTDTDLKALILKSMPPTWQNSYLLKGTRITDDFRQMLAYFVHFQSITDLQATIRSNPGSATWDQKKHNKYARTNHERSGRFPVPIHGGRTEGNRIPRKTHSTSQGPFVDFRGPCPVHPMSTHTWGDCFNNPKNKVTEGPNNKIQHERNHGQGHFYLTRGQGCGQGQGCHFYNAPCLPNPFPTLYIEQAPTNTPTDALSTVTNTDYSNMSNNQTYMVKHIQKPNRGETHSQWLYDNVVNCKAVNMEDINCCKTAKNKIC